MSITPGTIFNPFKAEELLPRTSPTLPLGNGPTTKVCIGCIPITGVNTALVEAQRSEHLLSLSEAQLDCSSFTVSNIFSPSLNCS